MENLENLCVSYVEPILTASCNSSLVKTINKLNQIAYAMDIPYPHIIASTEYESNKTRFMFTGHKDWIRLLSQKMESSEFDVSTSIQNGLFISGFGLSSSNYEQVLFEKLENFDLKILKYIRDAKGLLLVYNESEKVHAVEFANSII